MMFKVAADDHELQTSSIVISAQSTLDLLSEGGNSCERSSPLLGKLN
jgi:hypothetical protein